MIDQSWYERPPGVPDETSAGGVVVRAEGGRVYVALAREQHFTSHVLPKGRVREGEDPEAAARREIAEETGLTNLTFLAPLGARQRLNFDRNAWKTTHYFLYVTTQRHATPADARHHSGFDWFPIDALPEMFWPEQRELIDSSHDRIIRALKATGRGFAGAETGGD